MKHLHSTLLLCAAICLHSCITDEYDLRKDIEVALSFTPDGFELGGTNSADIPLSQVIKLDEDGQLTTDSLGNYLFYKKSHDMDTTTVCIGQGSLCNGTDDTFSFTIHDNPTLTLSPNRFDDDLVSVDFDLAARPSFSPDPQSESIRDLLYIKTSMAIDVDFYFEHLLGSTYSNGTYIDRIIYEVPYFYDLVDPSELHEEYVNVTEGHSHRIHIKGVDFTKQPDKASDYVHFDGATGAFTMSGEVRVKFHIQNVKAREFNQGKDAVAHVRVMAGTLGTTEVTGRFNKSEDVDVDDITFDNLPDFIRDEEVVIDIENPIIRLTLDNEVPATVSLNAIINNYRNGEVAHQLRVGDNYGTDRISFAGGRRSSVWISRQPVEIPDSVSSNVVIPNMMDLIRQMPESIGLQAKASTDSSEVVVLSLAQEYKAKPDYELVAPLIMGPDMRIVYKKDVTNLHDKLKHVDVDAIEFTAQVANNLPLDLRLQITPHDASGHVLSDIDIIVPEHLPAQSVTPMRCVLRNSSSERHISRLDRFSIKAYAESGEALKGQPLNKNQNLRMTDVNITLKTLNQ